MNKITSPAPETDHVVAPAPHGAAGAQRSRAAERPSALVIGEPLQVGLDRMPRPG